MPSSHRGATALLRLGLSVSMLVMSSSRVAEAQVTHTPLNAAMDGTVVDSAGAGLEGVDVILLDSHQAVRTKATGSYRFDSLEAGPHVLRFRRLGLQPVTLSIVALPNDITGVDVVMQRWVHQLETVEIQASSGDVLRVPKAFADRMRGMGTYLTEADILRRHAMRTADIFRGIPGVAVTRDGSQVLSGRLGSINPQYHDSSCPQMPVYLNGGAVSVAAPPGVGTSMTPATRQNGGSGASAPTALTTTGTLGVEAIAPQEIIGIEIYRGPAEMPTTLPPSMCGAIVIWAK